MLGFNKAAAEKAIEKSVKQQGLSTENVEALVKANKFLQQGEKLDGLRRLPVRLHKTQVVKRWRKWRKSAGP